MLISKSKVYELAFSSIKEQHINEFLGQYIPNVFPIMAEYGGRFLINGTIQNSSARKFPAKSFALLEWSSIDQFIEINKDKRVIPLIGRRNQYLDFIMEGCFYGVPEDIDLEIPENRTMSLLLSDRAILEDRNIRFQSISDIRNSEVSLNLYFSSDLMKQYDEDKDIEEFLIHIA
jgi:uncharacterized protein (DUF1330 family)